MEMFEGVIDSLLKLSPIFGLLMIAIWYLYKEKKSYKQDLDDERDTCHQEIAALNKEMREGEKENLVIISKLSDVIDRLFDDNKDQHELIKQALKDEMRDIRELIKEKINELKN